MSDPFAVLAENIRNLVEGRVVDVEAMREALEAIQRGRESLRFELQGLEVVRLRDNAYLLERAEAAERKLAAFREAAAPFRSERGYCCDGLPPDCIHDALRKALEGEAK